MPIQKPSVATQVPVSIRKRFDDLADITGMSTREILRHCIHYSLDHIEKKLRDGDLPPDPYKEEKIKTPKPKPAYVPPAKTMLDSPPSLMLLIKNGVVPDVDPDWLPDWVVPVTEGAEEPSPPPVTVLSQEPEPTPVTASASERPRRRRRSG